MDGLKHTLLSGHDKEHRCVSTCCTLVEGNYHVGAACLINSLVACGFVGDIYVGYRGLLPQWAIGHAVASETFPDIKQFNLSPMVAVIFVPFDPPGHFTNFKPHWMREIFRKHAPKCDRVFYFDPDIIVEISWTFFERWVNGGVALAEDISSPLAENHPKRVEWRNIFARSGIELRFRYEGYANGGFIGVDRSQEEFLQLLERLIELVGIEVGGLDVAAIRGGRINSSKLQYSMPFSATDQDALNAAVEAYLGEISLLGPDIMGFKPGGHVMTHALGSAKPWTKHFVRSILSGHPPTRADLAFWRHADGPLRPYSAVRLFYTRLILKVARVLGRFYRAYV